MSKISIEFLDTKVLEDFNKGEIHFFDVVIDMQGQSMNILFDDSEFKNKINLITKIGDGYHGAKGVLIKNFNEFWVNKIVMMDTNGDYCFYPFVYVEKNN